MSCEGYDYPDDPYILRGSCSLLFRLELTEEGERKVKNSDSFGSGFYQSRKDSSDSGAGAIVIIVILVLAYGVYKFFLSNQQPQQTFGDGDGFARPSWQNHQAPPPPGFKPSFTGRAPNHYNVRIKCTWSNVYALVMLKQTLMVSSRLAQTTWPTGGANIALPDILVQDTCSRNALSVPAAED